MIFFNEEWQSHLESELALGKVLLQRQETSHGRTRYFRRLDMAFRAIEKSSTLNVFQNLQEWKSVQAKTITMSSKRSKGVDECWSLKKDRDEEKLHAMLCHWSSQTSPELRSRLEGCVELLVAELSRGFFVPWNLTALAVVARIWQCVGALQSQIRHDLRLTDPNSARLDQRTKTERKINSHVDERMQEILRSIGIRVELGYCQDDDGEAEQDPSEAHQEVHKAKEKSNEPGSNIMDQTNDDVGETMHQIYAARDAKGSNAKQRHPKQNKKKNNKQIKDNETSVREWQESRKKASKKKGQEFSDKDKNKNTKPSPKKREPDEQPASGKKKRKKKKKNSKNGDFFDDLFS